MPLVVAAFFLAGCNVNVIYHDEDKAIESANLFLKTVIRADYATAYAQISERAKQVMPFEKFEVFFKTNQERVGAFAKVVFDSYQPVPGQRAIQLYYNVSHQKGGNILYHLVLDGDEKMGYKILIVDVGNHIPYPSNMKYLGGMPRTKKNKVIEVPVL